MFRREIHSPWQQRAGSGTSGAGEGWNIVDVNFGWQELSASLPSARTSSVSKAIGLKESQCSQVWGSPTRTGEASRRLELCLLQYNDCRFCFLKVLCGVSCSSPAVLASCNYLPVAVRSTGTQETRRSYIGLQGMLQVCIK